MKNIIKAFAMMIIGLICNSNSQAQITLDFTTDTTLYGYLFYPTKISDYETKYVFLDTAANTFGLYNLDLTPFLTNISVPSPLTINGVGYYHVMYISRSLFDCDTSNIEYLFATQNSGGNPLRVMRTDGTVLLYADTSVGPYCLGCPGGTTLLRPILTTESGTKLITMYSGSSTTGARKISVYSLCGSLPTGSEEYDLINSESTSYVRVSPNPSDGHIQFDIKLPDNLYTYELTILNNNSQELRSEKISVLRSVFSIDIRNYRSGTYYYSLASKNKVLQTGKFLLTK